MPDRTYHVHAFPDPTGLHMVTIEGLGLYVTAGKDDDGQPYVSINTEEMAAEHTYDEHTGLRGTEAPYDVEQDGEDAVVVFKPTGETVARHYPAPAAPVARHAAQDHALMLNNAWPTCCGMPVLSVHLGGRGALRRARPQPDAARGGEDRCLRPPLTRSPWPRSALAGWP
jgi:hypothetical protein